MSTGSGGEVRVADLSKEVLVTGMEHLHKEGSGLVHRVDFFNGAVGYGKVEESHLPDDPSTLCVDVTFTDLGIVHHDPKVGFETSEEARGIASRAIESVLS